MQEKKNNSYPLGICQRLFNFIMNGFIASGLKRVKLGQPAVAGSMVAQKNRSSSKLNGEVMTVHFLDHENSKDDLGSQIGFSFKESEGLESWTQVGDKFGSPIYGPQKDDAVLQSGKITTTPVKHQEPRDKATEDRKKIGSEMPRLKELQGRSFQNVEPNQIPVDRSRGLKKTATVNDSAEEEKRKSKGKNIEVKESEDLGDKSTKKGNNISTGPSTKNSLTLAVEDEKMKVKTPSPTKIRHFLGNINEISDDFIRSRKEAMSKTLS